MKRTDPANGLVLRRGNFWFNRTVKGQRQWHNLETPDLVEAIQRKAELLKNPIIADYPDSLDASIERYLRWKLDNAQYRVVSAINNRTGLRKLAAFMGPGATVQSVRKSRIQAWYDDLRKSHATSTAERYLTSAQAFFSWVSEHERARNDNPARGIIVERPTQRARVKYADRDLRDRLITEAPTDDLRFILFAGFHAGLRLTEISEARVFWFDLSQGVLHVQATPLPRGARPRSGKPIEDNYGMTVKPFWTKGKKDRTIPLSPSFKEFLLGYLSGREPQEFVGEPERTCPQGFYRWPFKRHFNDYMAKQKCKWVTPHVMRHTFASLLAIKGVSLYKIAAWLGDTIVIAEQHYAHLAPVDADIRHLE